MKLTSKGDIIEVCKKLKKDIVEDDFNKYWNGFIKSDLALYDDENVYFIDYSNDRDVYIDKWNSNFFGSTVIKYNDKYMAIWDIKTLKPNTSYEKLYSGIVHEMFHCYQNEIGDKRYPNEVMAVNYPSNKENITLRTLERKYLLRAVFERDIEEKNKLISQFISYREKRKDIIGDYLDYELGLESMEGTAMYVEYKGFLEKSLLPREFVLSKYGLDLSDYPKDLKKLRPSCYSAGVFICLLLDKLVPDWKVEYIQSQKFLYDILKGNIKLVQNSVSIEDYSIGEYLIQIDKVSRFREINKVKSGKKYKIILRGDMGLAGFDPMNIVKYKDKILHKHFIKIRTNDKEYFIKGSATCKHKDSFWKVEEVEIYTNKEPVIYDGKLVIGNKAHLEGSISNKDNIYRVNL